MFTMCAGRLARKTATSSVLVQEESGIHVGISPDLRTAARHASAILKQHYDYWLDKGRYNAWGSYKRDHFTVAVGGGNTIKSQFSAWLTDYHSSIDWLSHVRFFILVESTGEPGRESAEQSLVTNFLVPLAEKLCHLRGVASIARKLNLPKHVDQDDVIDAVVARLCHPINLAAAGQALEHGQRPRALKLARAECERYQADIRDKLGASMAFHCIICGIGKDGSLGALKPYTPELAQTEPGALVLQQANGALRITLNRGVFNHAGFISLIVSGTLKLQAIGRLEMSDYADFEQTVMETPLRLLRETWDIADRVYVFADEQSLHFDETVFEFSERGELIQNKAETRRGDEERGVHALLIHGYLGLFSLTNLLIKLPSSWTVSAVHRGSRAKFLRNEEIFPHHGRVLRKAVLKIWRQGRPVPVLGHSMGGVILDHLLLTLLTGYDAEIRPYNQLGKEQRDLVDALRASGIIHLATFAPVDGPNAGENIKSLVSHLRKGTPLDYGGFERIYEQDADGKLLPIYRQEVAESADSLAGLDRFLRRRAARPLVNSLNVGIRSLLNNPRVQQQLLNANTPYVLRLVGSRLLKTISIYGVLKEVNAALHDPEEYQRRHLKALDMILEYDIPYLCIVHKDDFLVSARRHVEEYRYLLRERMKKEGVQSDKALRCTVRLELLEHESGETAIDPLNPHLLVMSTNNEGKRLARQVTAAMTRFVNENVARATARGTVKTLPSVRRWQRKQPQNAGN